MMKKSADTTQSAINLKELTAAQREEYKADMLEYNMLEKFYERTTRELQIINNAIKTSAQQYISSNELRSFARKIIKLLAARYKLDQSKIIQQIHKQ
jgi:RNA polymerase-interacting CarD/CdnL/TRCF family regulator